MASANPFLFFKMKRPTADPRLSGFRTAGKPKDLEEMKGKLEEAIKKVGSDDAGAKSELEPLVEEFTVARKGPKVDMSKMKK